MLAPRRSPSLARSGWYAGSAPFALQACTPKSSVISDPTQKVARQPLALVTWGVFRASKQERAFVSFPRRVWWYILDSNRCVNDRSDRERVFKMAVQLTEKAAGEIRRVQEQQNMEPETFLRIGVTGGGCSGFSYSLGFDKQFDEKADSKYNFHGLDVVVDKKSLLYLDGTTVDFYEGIERRGFTFENPNAVKSCGCGSSFQA